jgi:hypothetical protein
MNNAQPSHQWPLRVLTEQVSHSTTGDLGSGIRPGCGAAGGGAPCAAFSENTEGGAEGGIVSIKSFQSVPS